MPGETFNVHIHPASEDAFIVYEGVGQMYLGDRWVDVERGDMTFAPPFVPHGARNPHTGPAARRFVTCGGPTPFDPFLYDAAGVSAEVA
jgi:mannose-6-phosphate isomerase-like protein (cupin superfamily)